MAWSVTQLKVRDPCAKCGNQARPLSPDYIVWHNDRLPARKIRTVWSNTIDKNRSFVVTLKIIIVCLYIGITA